jgi:hypothetical protein
MATKFEFGIDWRRKGFVCWDARPGNALNLLPRPLTYTTTDYRPSGAGATVSNVYLNTPYGFRAFSAQTGTGLNSGFEFGREDGTLLVDDIDVEPSAPYSVAVWIRGLTGYPGVTFLLRVRDQANTALFTLTSITLTNSWQKFTVSGSTGAGSDKIYFQLFKNNHAADVVFEAAGFMLVSGSTMPAGYNGGNIADLYDNVTDQVMDAEWFLGIHAPYQDDADDSILRLKLDNSDRLYSPEYVSTPLAGSLMPYRPVTVRSSDGVDVRSHWTGWVESIQPKVGKFSARDVEIKAAGAMLFFEDVETRIPVLENRRTDEILADLLNEVQIAPPLHQSMLLDTPGYAELDVTTFLPDPIIPNALNPGQTTLAYAADNWVQPLAPGETQGRSFNVYRAIKDVVAAERGRFFFDRDGKATFWDRHHLLKQKYDPLEDPTFDDVMQGLSYEFAGLGEFKNDIIVTCHPRTVSAGSEDILWSLDQPITISAGERRKLTVSYKDDSENRIGGKNVHLANVTFTEGSASIILTAGGNRAALEIVNDQRTATGNPLQGKVVLATCELRGTKITDFGSMEASSRDELSVNLYGRRALRMNLPSIDNLDNAQSIADFERGRRSYPSGKVRTLSLTSHAKLGGNQHSKQLQLSIGDLIRVKEAQTAHDDTYFIIGEQHRLSQPEEYFETTWYLESATDANWFVVEQSKLNEGVLAY